MSDLRSGRADRFGHLGSPGSDRRVARGWTGEPWEVWYDPATLLPVPGFESVHGLVEVADPVDHVVVGADVVGAGLLGSLQLLPLVGEIPLDGTELLMVRLAGLLQGGLQCGNRRR